MSIPPDTVERLAQAYDEASAPAAFAALDAHAHGTLGHTLCTLSLIHI